MGTTTSHCYFCNKNSSKNKDYLLDALTEPSDVIVRLQAVIRGFLVRKKYKTFRFSKNNEQDIYSTSSQKGDGSQIREISMSYSTEIQESNPKIVKLKNLLPKFELDERETYLITTSHMKTKALMYPNGGIYKGMINDKWQREGYGKYFLPDGSIYEGFFKENKMEGRGRLLNIEGFVYEGEFKNCQASGYGKCIGLDGTVYKGSWQNDKQNGIGNETYSDTSQYIGNFVNGKKNGKGKFHFPDGNSYEGDFYNNEIKGEGIYRWKDGRVFIGEWNNNKMNGYGIFFWPDKKKYYGHYSNNNKNDFGAFIWADGKVFEGFWKNGKQHGFGKIKTQEKEIYGEWYEGKKIKTIEDEIEQRAAENSIMEIKNEPDYLNFKEKIEKYEEEIKLK